MVAAAPRGRMNHRTATGDTTHTSDHVHWAAMVQLPKKIRLPEDAYGNTEAVFHVVIRAAIGSAPFEDPGLAQQTWALITDEREREDIDLLAACLMPDHAHFLLKPAGRSVLEWANAFKIVLNADVMAVPEGTGVVAAQFLRPSYPRRR